MQNSVAQMRKITCGSPTAEAVTTPVELLVTRVPQSPLRQGIRPAIRVSEPVAAIDSIEAAAVLAYLRGGNGVP
jgi:hypothetical protein